MYFCTISCYLEYNCTSNLVVISGWAGIKSIENDGIFYIESDGSSNKPKAIMTEAMRNRRARLGQVSLEFTFWRFGGNRNRKGDLVEKGADVSDKTFDKTGSLEYDGLTPLYGAVSHREFDSREHCQREKWECIMITTTSICAPYIDDDSLETKQQRWLWVHFLEPSKVGCPFSTTQCHNEESHITSKQYLYSKPSRSLVIVLVCECI